MRRPRCSPEFLSAARCHFSLAFPRVAHRARARTGTVGLRIPDHPVPRALAAAVGGAITGTSANRSGAPGAWRTPGEIENEFAGEVDWILWDGPAPALPGDASLVPSRITSYNVCYTKLLRAPEKTACPDVPSSVSLLTPRLSA